jgi:hypothetical protein
MRYDGLDFSERLTWEREGYMEVDEWMMRWEKDHADQEGGRWTDVGG